MTTPLSLGDHVSALRMENADGTVDLAILHDDDGEGTAYSITIPFVSLAALEKEARTIREQAIVRCGALIHYEDVEYACSMPVNHWPSQNHSAPRPDGGQLTWASV